MADIIDTATLKPTPEDLESNDKHQIYCGLDSCLTKEIHSKIHPQLDKRTRIVYDFARALQAPVLEMMLRGILTDEFQVAMLIGSYTKRRKRVNSILQRYAIGIWGKELNPNSPKQLKEFFYETMNVPEIYVYEKGEKKLSVNRDTLVKIAQYRFPRPVVLAVLSFKEFNKKIGVLNSGIDSDGKMRFSYNIGGTNTGRFSSNKNVFGGGTNGNNITNDLRRVFVTPEGKKFAYLDQEQA